eukprot:8992454-Prorocentrum_lima.AAC.1
MSPHLLVGALPTTHALSIRRSLRIELDLVNQLACLAHDRGAVVVLQCRYGHGYEQQPIRQLCVDD